MSDVTTTDVQNDVPVVEVRGGLLGFPEFTQFSLIKLNDEGLVYRLQSLEEAAINFVVVPAASFFPNYAPVVDDEVARRFDLESGPEVLLLLVVTLGEIFQRLHREPDGSTLTGSKCTNRRTNNCGE